MERTLTEQRAHVEGWLDFDPEELGDNDRKPLIQAMRTASDRLERAAQTGARSLPLFENPIVLLAGAVNAGKSSLFNALVGDERALVSDQAGTTRDWIEVELTLPAGRIRLRDSAGLREAADQVEAAGIRRAQALQQQADLILWCAPAGQVANAPAGAVLLNTKCDEGRGPGLRSRHTAARGSMRSLRCSTSACSVERSPTPRPASRPRVGRSST